MTIVSWNAEGLRPKQAELQRWLPTVRADVVAIQEAQLPKVAPRLAGYQPPVVVRRARGRITGAAVKGGDVCIYVRAGLHFTVLEGPFLARTDDTTEICGVRILGQTPTDIINIYRPPIRATGDDRQDNFDPQLLPSDSRTLLVGDINGHHPSWDDNCEEADAVGERVADWLEDVGWIPLNNGAPTLISYRTGSKTAPDLAACSGELAGRASWSTGTDIGSDHLPMIVELQTTAAPPRRTRKTKWAHHKANWLEFQRVCEEALSVPAPPGSTVQQLATRFTSTIQEASKKHIPRGARRDAKPWALHPELQEAISDRRAARMNVRKEDPSTKARWIEAKQRVSKVEARVSREQFRDFVTTELNRQTSTGRVSRLLKRWEGAADDDHREGEAMRVGDRLLVTPEEKANAFAAQYAHVSRQVRTPKIDRDARRRLATKDLRRCSDCAGAHTGCCSPFTEEELTRAVLRLQLKKSPGPDGITHEMIKYLGPVARSALLHLINLSWVEGVVPREWRAATVVPIPKATKDKRLLSSYRPIALTSCISKLAERLILARLEFVAESRGLVPPEQVGFTAKRSAEDSIGRLVQNVQDGWQRPKRDNRANRPDGTTAQKYLLTAYDFSRAYDVVDHRLLRVRLLELGLPLCLVQWVWGWLRDRRVRVEVQGALSKERIFRAGLPQGSVLSPQLFLLWAAGLAEALRAPGTSPYVYADDTAVLCAGNTMEVATRRAQEAADTLAAWARHNKMVVAGEKTQLLVLSQNARDAVDCAIKVAGKTVKASDTLVLLGVEIDRRLQFGAHCRRLKRRVRPRIAHLRRLSGRSWGLDEGDLRTVANGYVRGAIEHAAAAWLPAAAPSHAELLEREMRAAARVVTGREEPDRPDHVLRRCPALMGTRLRRTGHINLTLEEVRGTELVAALAAAARAIQGRLATL